MITFFFPLLLKGLNYKRTILWWIQWMNFPLSALSGISWMGLKWLSSSTIDHQFPGPREPIFKVTCENLHSYPGCIWSWLLFSDGHFATWYRGWNHYPSCLILPFCWWKAAFCVRCDNPIAQLSFSSRFPGRPVYLPEVLSLPSDIATWIRWTIERWNCGMKCLEKDITLHSARPGREYLDENCS